MRRVTSQLPLRPGVIHLALEPRPVIEAAERLAPESQDRGRVVIGKIGLDMSPSLPEGRPQRLPQ